MMRSRSSIVDAAFGLRFDDTGTFLNCCRDEVDLGFSAWVELSELANEEEIINISITVKDEDDTEGALSTVDPDSLELKEDFRDGRYYAARLNAKKANLTQEEIDDEAGTLAIEVNVGKFDTKYTPYMDEGVQRFVEAAIRGERKPNTTSAAISQDHADRVAELLCRLSKVNRQDVSQNPDVRYAAVQLQLLAQKVMDDDRTSDLSGYAALPGLLNKLCGPAAAE